jgi:beta propeller repeat protein
MKRSQYTVLIVLLLFGSMGGPLARAERWVQWPVLPGPDDQENPAIDGTIVAWQEFVSQYGDYDIFVVDINDLDNVSVAVIGDASDQTHPAVYGSRVVWQDWIVSEDSADWDIRMADLSDFDEPIGYIVSDIPANDEQRPAIYGNIVVWQDTNGSSSNVFGADVTDPERPREFVVAAYEGDQQRPAIWRTTVIWQDSYFGDNDIMAADILMQDRPAEFAVVLLEGQQQNPAISGNTIVWEDDFYGDWDIFGAQVSDQNQISEFVIVSMEGQQRHPDVDGHLVVWQDDRDGNWNIYGHNLVTGRTFQITDDPADQIHPAISGNMVVWQDNRQGPWNIYAAVLDGPEFAASQAPAGDLHAAGRADVADLAILAEAWLESHVGMNETRERGSLPVEFLEYPR